MEPGEMVPIRKGVELRVSLLAGRSPALVFVHGGLGNRFNWRSPYENARRQGRSALAYDLGGHGQSSAYGRYSIRRHGRDLSRLLDRLAISNPILCCHSYGVPIGLEWAARHPTRALVLIAGGTHDLDPWWEIPVMTLMALGLRHLFHLRPLQRLAQSLVSPQRTAVIERYFADNPIPTEPDPYRALQIFWEYDLFSRSQNADRLRSIPTLAITGGRDSSFSYAMGEQLISHFRRSRHLHVPEAGHIVMAEYPDVVNEAIERWIVELETGEDPSPTLRDPA